MRFYSPKFAVFLQIYGIGKKTIISAIKYCELPDCIHSDSPDQQHGACMCVRARAMHTRTCVCMTVLLPKFVCQCVSVY